MARPSWKGYLGFGLVQLPVQLYPATQEDDIDFTMLDRKNLAPVGYQRINKKTKKVVPWNETVRGFEVSKGKYVVIGQEDLRAAHPKMTRSIEITDFVDAAEIAPLRWSNAYFIAPDPKASKKPYVVLREALRRSGKVGVAKVVIRTREHLCAVTIQDDVLVLANLRFDTELRDAEAIEELADLSSSKSDVKATKKEIDLADQLIETLTGPFDSSKYRDEYQDALRDYIKKKVKSGELGEAPPLEGEEAEEPETTAPTDLMAALQASLKQGPSKAPSKERPKAAKRAARTPRRAATPRRGASKPSRKRPSRAHKSA
ncbi:MAG: Ku protein [Polyangiaceae bacterium]|nr:Ku protein [Polyangiaceae bacterium]